MASLSANFNLGNGSASGLLKSAASLSREINTYNDVVQAQNYAVSGHTDEALAQYQQYLEGRASQLQSSGTVADATKAVEIQNTIRTAINSNITASILRENIQIMAGNASDGDKLSLIGQQFQRAVSIGDMTTAQSLESQAYSLSQSIQLKAQAAAAASTALAKSSASSTASAENNVATQIETAFKQLNADAGAAGPSKLNSTLKTWVQNNKQQLLSLADAPGVNPDTKASIEKAVNTSQPNYQDIAAGVGQAMISAHYQAYLAELPYNPETAQGYLNSATDLANGNTPIKTLAGSLTLQDIQNWQANPAMFTAHENADTGTLQFSYASGGKPNSETTINGYKFDANGQVVANFTGNDFGQGLSKQQAAQVTQSLNKLGFNFDKQTVSTTSAMTDGISIQATAKIAKYLQPVLAGNANAQLKAYVTPQGIQIASLDQSGKGHIYLVAQDGSGKHAVYEATGQYPNGNPIFGKQTASGDYGFNQANNSLWKTAGTSSTSPKTTTNTGTNNAFNSLHTNVLGMLGRGDLNSMVADAQAKAQQITLQRQAAEAALKVSQPIQLSVPNIKGIQLPAQQIQPRPNVVAQIQPTVNPQQTASPQPRTANPQPATTSPQANNFNPQQGGNVVATLTPTSGAGIKL